MYGRRDIPELIEIRANTLTATIRCATEVSRLVRSSVTWYEIGRRPRKMSRIVWGAKFRRRGVAFMGGARIRFSTRSRSRINHSEMKTREPSNQITGASAGWPLHFRFAVDTTGPVRLNSVIRRQDTLYENHSTATRTHRCDISCWLQHDIIAS